MYAVFCCKKVKYLTGTPHLDPLDFGCAGEMEPQNLMRRGRVGLFKTRESAEAALKATAKACEGQEWLKTFAFRIMECVSREV